MVRLEIDGSVARRGGDLARIITKTIREQHGPTSKELYKRDPVTREWQPDWKLGDALIAASAERAKAAILTNNKDFEYLRNVVHVPIIQFGQIEIA
jgi:predicted nucleic acid-binding protein